MSHDTKFSILSTHCVCKLLSWAIEKSIIQLIQDAAYYSKNYSWIFGPGLPNSYYSFLSTKLCICMVAIVSSYSLCMYIHKQSGLATWTVHYSIHATSCNKKSPKMVPFHIAGHILWQSYVVYGKQYSICLHIHLTACHIYVSMTYNIVL